MLARFHALDAFAALPREISHASTHGGIITLATAAVCAVLLSCELSGLFTTTTTTRLAIDRDAGEMLRVNFNISFPDLECQYLSVGVRDSFGTDRLHITKNINLRDLIRNNPSEAYPYTEEELLALDKEEFTEDEVAELESNWVGSSDKAKHTSFDKVIEVHDFTIVLFHAMPTKAHSRVVCKPCRELRPVWEQVEANINGGKVHGLEPVDRRLPVHALRVNCVDFLNLCEELAVVSFPSIRFFQRGKGPKRYLPFVGDPTRANIIEFVRTQVAKSREKSVVSHFHHIFKQGCEVSGHVDVTRVPGTLHIEPRAVPTPGKILNFAVVNMSHTINHLSFGMQGPKLSRKKRTGLPPEFHSKIAPLDGKVFVTEAFHQAPHHYIKVVSTVLEPSPSASRGWRTPAPLRSFQMTYQSRTSTVPRRVTPSARFSYDLAPLEVIISEEPGRHWYDFFTAAFAGVGGTVAVGMIFTQLLSTLPFLREGSSKARRR